MDSTLKEVQFVTPKNKYTIFYYKIPGFLVPLRTLTLPVLLNGSETWTVKARDAIRISEAEMKCMRRTSEYTWTDYKTNT
jgi:hypothetical protein